jgi:hypothetical protein
MTETLQSSKKKIWKHVCGFFLGVLSYEFYSDGFSYAGIFVSCIMTLIAAAISIPIINYIDKRKKSKMGIKVS